MLTVFHYADIGPEHGVLVAEFAYLKGA